MVRQRDSHGAASSGTRSGRKRRRARHHAPQRTDAQVLAAEAWLASRPPCQSLIARCARQLAVGLLPRALEQLVRFRHANRAVRYLTRPLHEFELSEAELMGLAPMELVGLCNERGLELPPWATKIDAIKKLLPSSAAPGVRVGAAVDVCNSAGPAVHACNRARLGFCCAAPAAWLGAELGGPVGGHPDELVQLVRSAALDSRAPVGTVEGSHGE